MPLPPPDSVRAAYADWEWSVAYEWPTKATTWRLDGGSARADLFVKVVISKHYPTALEEAERMRWARPYLPVPEVIDCGSDDDGSPLAEPFRSGCTVNVFMTAPPFGPRPGPI